MVAGGIGVPAMVTVTPASGSPLPLRTCPDTACEGAGANATSWVVGWPSVMTIPGAVRLRKPKWLVVTS